MGIKSKVTSKKATRRFNEGTIKKGGVNPRPSNPKPNVKPVAQKPPPREGTGKK